MHMENIEEMYELMKKGEKFFLEAYYSDKRSFLKDCKLFLSKNPDKYNEIKILIKIINNKDKTSVFYTNSLYNIHEKKYVFNFQKILNEYFINKERAYKIANDLYLKPNNFNRDLNYFNNQFINSEIFIKDLMDICNHIEIKSSKKKDGKYVPDNTLITNPNYLDIVYDSGLSLIDYAHYNLIDYTEYSESIYSRSCNKAKEVRKREDKTIPTILDIIKKIANNELSYVEYFKLSKLNFYMLKRIACENNLYSKEVAIFVNKYIKQNSIINKEVELRVKKVIKNVEVPHEIIEEALNFLEDNNIPLTKKTYNEVLHELVKKRTL